jgi:NTP pyrophosphatase (non-canonical NTP hydrolase)
VNYTDFVRSRLKSGEAILSDMNADGANLLHLAVGVAGEAGELLDAIKKHAIYGKPLDVENVIEELGDLQFYITGMIDALGLTDHGIQAANVAKLTKRYPAGYSNKDAIARADK